MCLVLHLQWVRWVAGHVRDLPSPSVRCLRHNQRQKRLGPKSLWILLRLALHG